MKAVGWPFGRGSDAAEPEIVERPVDGGHVREVALDLRDLEAQIVGTVDVRAVGSDSFLVSIAAGSFLTTVQVDPTGARFVVR